MKRKKLKIMFRIAWEAIKIRFIAVLTNNNDILLACVKRIEEMEKELDAL